MPKFNGLFGNRCLPGVVSPCHCEGSRVGGEGFLILAGIFPSQLVSTVSGLPAFSRTSQSSNETISSTHAGVKHKSLAHTA